MNKEELFAQALGLGDRWIIRSVEFDSEGGVFDRGKMQIHIDYRRGENFEDGNGRACPVYDSVEKMYKHIDFFQHECYLYCKIPRVKTPEGNVVTVQVPWARPGSRFTLQFESYALALVQAEMPVNRVAKQMGVYPNRIWRILDHYIYEARLEEDYSEVTQIGVDEKSYRKGHKYLTVCSDLEKHRVIHVDPGRSKSNFQRIKDFLEDEGAESEQVTDICIDPYPAYIGGALEHFEHASITFDRYHIKQMLNRAMDLTRRAEQREHQELKKTRYLWLRNDNKLSANQRSKVHYLTFTYPKIGEAYRLKLMFDDLYTYEEPSEAEDFLNDWCALVVKSGLKHFQDFVNTLHAHWYGIIQYFQSRISNGIVESINQKIALAIRRARGFKNLHNLSNMIYLIAGKLSFNYLPSH